MNESINYHPLESEDIDLLKEFLCLSLYVPPGEAPFPEDILDNPALLKYHEGWG
ncbi:MAG: hypothetical protein AAGG75_09355 [Bacteroidota bacterium]